MKYQRPWTIKSFKKCNLVKAMDIYLNWCDKLKITPTKYPAINVFRILNPKYKDIYLERL